MRNELIRSLSASEAASSISFLGNLPHSEAMKKLASAKLLILPSLCFEGFPMVVQEAYAYGVPIAASNIGSLPYLITESRTGALFTPGNAESLLASVQSLLADDKQLRLLGTQSKQEFDSKYTAGMNYDILMSIYASAAAHRRAKLN